MDSHVVYHRISFPETDMSGLVHFSNFFRWMEMAEHDLHRQLGRTIHPDVPGEDGVFGWPRVHASCDFKSPLKFEDVIAIELIILELRTSSISYGFRVHRVWPSVVEQCGVGKLTSVCVTRKNGKISAHPIPAALRDALRARPAAMDEPAAAEVLRVPPSDHRL